MENKQPFVIQFSDLDEFIQECHEVGVDVVRVNCGTFATGNTPAFRYDIIDVAAIDTLHMAVLSLFLIVGAYDEIYGKPFGPTAERKKQIISEWLETAEARVKGHLESAGLPVRSGRIHTGLTGREIQKAYWDNFRDIYDAQKETTS